MSHHISSPAWKTQTSLGRPISIADKLVLVALADMANDEGFCWPSVASLMERCPMHERTIRASIGSLGKAGHIEIHERPGRSNYYKVTPGVGPGVPKIANSGDKLSNADNNLGGENTPQTAPLVYDQGSALSDAPPLAQDQGTPGVRPGLPLAQDQGTPGVRPGAIGTIRESLSEPSVNRQSERASGAPTTDGEVDAASDPEQDPPPVATQSAVSVPSQGRSTEAEGRRESADPKIEPVPRRGKRDPLASRLPLDFELTPDRRAMALAEGLDADRTFAKFCDYWKAAPEAKARKADWDATWRNWCRTEADKIAGITPKPTPAQKATSEERRSLLRLMERREAIGIGGFRDPYAGESADQYRWAQDAEWNKRQPRPEPRFPDAKAARS